MIISGDATTARSMVVARATTPPAMGYRFPVRLLVHSFVCDPNENCFFVFSFTSFFACDVLGFRPS